MYVIERVEVALNKPRITPVDKAKSLYRAKRKVKKYNRESCASDLVYYQYRILEEALR